MTAYPGQTRTTPGQLCTAQSQPDVIQPGFEPGTVVTPLALRWSALDCCVTPVDWWQILFSWVKPSGHDQPPGLLGELDRLLNILPSNALDAPCPKSKPLKHAGPFTRLSLGVWVIASGNEKENGCKMDDSLSDQETWLVLTASPVCVCMCVCVCACVRMHAVMQTCMWPCVHMYVCERHDKDDCQCLSVHT
jgi:hypothetical protein